MKKAFALLTAAAFGLAFVTAIAEEAALAQAQQQAPSLTVLASSKEEIKQMKKQEKVREKKERKRAKKEKIHQKQQRLKIKEKQLDAK